MRPSDFPSPVRFLGLRAFCFGVTLSLLLPQFRAQSQVWTPTSAPVTDWFCVASSATGSNLFAGGRGPYNGNEGYPAGPIYVSHDAGSTWSESGAPIARWLSLASSADGSVVIAGTDDRDPALFVSTNSGVSWAPRTPPSAWGDDFVALALSPDAHFLVAANSHLGRFSASQVFASTNLGLDWIEIVIFYDYVQSLACSADGNTILAGALEGIGYTTTWFSTNAGSTWSATHPPGFWWQSVACSPDGTKPVVTSGTGSSGPVYWSPDAGVTSHQITNSDAAGWGGKLTMSADAARLGVAMDQNLGGPILLSTNSGLNWNTAEAPITNWHAIACSADGNRFVAVAYSGWENGGQIYTAQRVAQPILSIARPDTNLLLSWIIPSSNFGLQQTPDLNSPSWSDVPIAPVPNWSNLRNEVVIPSPATPVFFRLASR